MKFVVKNMGNIRIGTIVSEKGSETPYFWKTIIKKYEIIQRMH